MVKVIPKNDTIRKLIKHPVGGPFRGQGAAEWPDDTYTARRIADGDVTVEQAEKKENGNQSERKEEQIDKKEQSVEEQPAEQKEERAQRSRTRS